jgi:serine/threonine-protein kinase
MELVEGQSLQEVLQTGHLFHWREVTRIAIDICSALKHAHDCGVIHRDLKPANLLQTSDGRIKLTDFGIAKLFGATHRTADGSVVGTADYMSPEQADGRPVTNRTDLYSLGAVMFTLLTRRTPFSGGNLPQVIHKLRYEEAPSVCRFAPDTPAELDQIIAELLRKEPQQRVATALVLANRLRAMEHALLTRGSGDSPGLDGVTRIEFSHPSADAPTQASVETPHPPTKISPTFADTSNSSKPARYAWNDATVVTSTSQADGDKSGESPPPNQIVVEAAAPRDRFTTIEEHQRQQAVSRDREVRGQPTSYASTVALVVAGILLVALCAWGLMPPTADNLYQRIQRVAQRDGSADALQDIERFLQRFPHDPRFQEVDDLRMDVECDWLASRLRLRKRKSDGHELEPYEERWLDAYHQQAKNPPAARTEFQSILAEFGAAGNSPEALSKVLAATKHQLKRMGH